MFNGDGYDGEVLFPIEEDDISNVKRTIVTIDKVNYYANNLRISTFHTTPYFPGYIDAFLNGYNE